jgi:DNA-directed RNA polymerase subunit K/omega
MPTKPIEFKVSKASKASKTSKLSQKDNKDKKVEETLDTKKHKKGGAKSANDPDMGSDDDYETDDQSNIDEDDNETDEVEVVPRKENNSDDDLEQKEESSEEESEEEEEPEEEQAEIQGDGEEGCIYRFTGKKKKVIDILADFEAEDDFSDDERNIDTTKYVDPDKRITKNYMTIYERVRLLGERAKQLSLGAKPMIKNVENLNPKDIAKLELENKVIPLIIIRTLPNGVKERWKVTELEIIN